MPWMEDTWSNLSQPVAILWVYSALQVQRGKNTIDHTPDFLKMLGTLFL